MINGNGVLIHTARMKLGSIQPHSKGGEISGLQGTTKGRACRGLLAVQGSLGNENILELVMMVKTMMGREGMARGLPSDEVPPARP